MKKILVVFALFVVHHTFSQQWDLVWSDEFNYTGLPDANKWDYDVGAGGWGNQELENYTKNRTENARVEGGNLILEARRDWFEGIEYSSARLVTRNKGDWTYGRIEVKAQIPLGQGLWPAIWMLPTDYAYGGWPASGEIDIMENYALNGIKSYEIEGNVHTQSYNHLIGTNRGAKITSLANIEDNYHVYAVNWFEDKIDFEVDGVVYFTFVNEGNWQAWPFDQRFHLILNVAVGGVLGTTPDPNIFPKRMVVDYVRVYAESTEKQSSTGVVTVFKDSQYSGHSTGLAVGEYTLSDLVALGVKDDDITSLQITEGYKATLYQDDNFGGGSTVINSNNSGLNGTWNDKVSSIRVETKGVTSLSGTYYLENRESGLVMDVDGGEARTANGANVQQWTKTYTKNQQFNFVHTNNGSYNILAVHSNKSLDVAEVDYANGGNIHQWDSYPESSNQQFILVPTRDGYFKLVAKHSGRILEIVNASHNQQANVQQYDNNNQTCGQWKLIPVNQSIGNGNGLTANYFKGDDFDEPAVTRIDETLDFVWGTGTPNTQLGNNYFSARWSGQIEAKNDGEYTFTIDADDGRRLWIDGQLIIDNWTGGDYEASGTKTLIAGQKVNIRVDYNEGVGNAKMRLFWSSPILPKEIVPKTQLYSNDLPTVDFTSPVINSEFVSLATVVLTANATDNGSVSKVEFYNGNTLLATDNNAPYSYTWNNISGGNYTVSARVFDDVQAVSTDQIIFSVVDPNIAPTVSLTNPNNNQAFVTPTNIVLSANATDSDGGVTKVEFYNGVTLLGTDATPPYSFAWSNIEAGNYVITAKAYDDETSTTSSSVLISVANPVILNVDPTVSLISPLSNESFEASRNISITADAKDTDGTITKVEFYEGITLLGTSIAPPYLYTIVDVEEGSYILTAKVYDNDGAITTSAEVEIQVVSTVSGFGYGTNKSSLIIYPNPVNTLLFIGEVATFNTAHVAIYDVRGNLILSKDMLSNELDVSSLEVGIYVLELSTEQGTRTTKLIKE